MQPLPPTVTTSILNAAATGFQSAADQLGSGSAAAATLDAAARSAYQGIPSLRMTTNRDSGSREVATALRDAADAATALATEIRNAPAGTDFSAHRDTIIGWSHVAGNAAFLVEPPLYAL